MREFKALIKEVQSGGFDIWRVESPKPYTYHIIDREISPELSTQRDIGRYIFFASNKKEERLVFKRIRKFLWFREGHDVILRMVADMHQKHEAGLGGNVLDPSSEERKRYDLFVSAFMKQAAK